MMDEDTRDRLIENQQRKERIQETEFWVTSGDVSGGPFSATECGLCGPHLEADLPEGRYVVLSINDYEAIT
jgi:hypothetical protein